MNLFNIIEEIEKIDPDFSDKVNPRRAAIKNITSFGSKVAMAAVPFAFGTMIKRAVAQTSTPSVVAILNYALTLEFLEAKFYANAVDKVGFIPANIHPYYQTIADDESKHVEFLINVIKSVGGTPVTSPSFDFSAGGGTGTGPLGNSVYTDLATFQKVAVAFEDTGVRAYKGQAENILANKTAAGADLYKTVLTAALSIHAVEARHASATRQLIGATPWIVSTTAKGNDTGVTLVDGNYDGEQNVIQGGVDVTTLKNSAGASTSVSVATAAFDEPLSMDAVLKLLVGTFIVK
ncbi:ferritin-like domain-containing protein [Mucilaginibacter flavus]|uniref:ferritin-like domain-containing protein n=1 Tax=Mucilaginibacter flavus TaxID=931504 RepID=UPI0025B3315D|nr:ferritin-like domain-containing protein [Mucilaginibacter flavus]MDN3581815.1 ferritin-like domain-containing protein [Mucilaginibacter flavus]